MLNNSFQTREWIKISFSKFDGSLLFFQIAIFIRKYNIRYSQQFRLKANREMENKRLNKIYDLSSVNVELGM